MRILASIVVLQLILFTTIGQAADIVWVRQSRGGGDGVNNPGPGEGSLTWEDDQWRQLIEGQGHKVIAEGPYDNLETIGDDAYDATIAEFEAADLVIFSRDTSSGDYNEPIEHDAWTSDFSTPMIIMTPYLLRNNRWGMVDNASIEDALTPMLVNMPEHPIFEGVELDASSELEFWSQLGDDDNIDLVGEIDFGNAEVLAEETDTGFPWIAFWEGTNNQDFFDGSPTFAGGPRLFLSAGSDDDPNTWGEKNITPAGDKIFLNAISFLTGDPGNPVVTCAPNQGDLDGNGTVEFADFLTLSANFGQDGGAAQGDADCNGKVEFADFLLMSANFGQTVGRAESVPEPNGLLLVAFGAMALGCVRRRRV